MSIRTISLVVTDEAADAAALAAAMTLAARENAHLDVTCLGVESSPLGSAAAMAGPVFLDFGRAEAVERAEGLARWARAALPPTCKPSSSP